jgi:hypothetical protein
MTTCVTTVKQFRHPNICSLAGKHVMLTSSVAHFSVHNHALIPSGNHTHATHAYWCVLQSHPPLTPLTLTTNTQFCSKPFHLKAMGLHRAFACRPEQLLIIVQHCGVHIQPNLTPSGILTLSCDPGTRVRTSTYCMADACAMYAEDRDEWWPSIMHVTIRRTCSGMMFHGSALVEVTPLHDSTTEGRA